MSQKPDEVNSDTSQRHRGRPKKYPESIKTGYLGFRLPEEEIKSIEAAATAVGESVSEYVRKAIESRMKELKPQLPSISISYEISPVKVVDNTSSQFQSRSPIVTVLDIQQRNLLTEDDSLNE